MSVDKDFKNRIGLNWSEKTKPSNRPMSEILFEAQKCFYEKNGYHPTIDECIQLTDEARKTMPSNQSNGCETKCD